MDPEDQQQEHVADHDDVDSDSSVDDEWEDLPWFLSCPNYEAQDGYAIEHRIISLEDAGYTLGKEGKTKNKICRASGCMVHVSESDGRIELRGGTLQRMRAWKYMHCYQKQRLGVHIDMSDVQLEEDPADITVIEVPAAALGYVMGKAAQCFISMEEEFGCLLFANSARGTITTEPATNVKKITVFGPLRARRAAELRIMSSVDTKMPGFYVNHGKMIQEETTSDHDPKGLDVAILQIPEADLNMALGRQGTTRKKIQRAAHCILEYIGTHAVFCGTQEEVSRAIFYFRLVGAHITNQKEFRGVRIEGRKDVTVVEVPKEAIGYVTGEGRQTLSVIEDTYGTLLFFCSSSSSHKEPSTAATAPSQADGTPTTKQTESLIIFGPRKARYGTMLKVMASVEGWYNRRQQSYYPEGTWKEQRAECEGFGTDYLHLQQDDLLYMIRHSGAIRRRVARASNAIIEYVGNWIMIVGNRSERRKAEQYLQWALQLRVNRHQGGIIPGANPTEFMQCRDDVLAIEISIKQLQSLSADTYRLARSIEEDSYSFLFPERNEVLYVFSFSVEGRRRAERRLMNDLEDGSGKPRRYPGCTSTPPEPAGCYPHTQHIYIDTPPMHGNSMYSGAMMRGNNPNMFQQQNIMPPMMSVPPLLPGVESNNKNNKTFLQLATAILGASVTNAIESGNWEELLLPDDFAIDTSLSRKKREREEA